MTTPNPATNEKIAELRKLARAVAHPVWFFSPERHITRPDGSMCALQMHVGYGTQFDDSETFDLFESCDEANYRYIAAANPATVLALLDRLDAERARADEAELDARENDEYLHECNALLGETGHHVLEGVIDGINSLANERDELRDERDASLADIVRLRNTLKTLRQRLLWLGENSRYCEGSAGHVARSCVADIDKTLAHKETP